MIFTIVKLVVALIMLALSMAYHLQRRRAKLPQDYRHAEVLGDLWFIGGILVMVLA